MPSVVHTYDIEAEEQAVAGLLHHICFDEVYFGIEEEMFLGKAVDDDGRSSVLKKLFSLIVSLRKALQGVPSSQVVYEEFVKNKTEQEKNQADAAYFSRLLHLTAPTEVTVRDAIRRIRKAFSNRMASQTIQESLQMLQTKGGAEAMEHMRKSVASRQRNVKDNIQIFDYVESFPNRREIQHKVLTGAISGPMRLMTHIRGLDAATAGFGAGELIIGVAPTGGGKCLGPEVSVLMYDGSIKRADKIVEGDLLMGLDSQSRRVLSTCSGYGPMYCVTPKKGESWTCNDVHVLTLRNGRTKEIVDISLDEYLKLSPKADFRHLNKQFSVGVDFENSTELPVSPYFVGVWLGDGTKHTGGKIRVVAVTKADNEIANEMHHQADIWGLKVKSEDSNGQRCPTYRLVSNEWRSNKLLDVMRNIFPNDCTIPHNYLTNSRHNRLQLLAGICDTDGYVHHGGFEIVQKRREIIDGVIFLARSLGFKALELKPKTINGTTYWRMSINGDCSTIPTRIARKQAKSRSQIKDACHTGFVVDRIADGPYVGWTLDGDGRFLLSDFTVTHNTITMQDVAINMIEKGGLRVAFFTKEMIEEEIGFRFDARYSGISHPKFFEYQLEEGDFKIWDAAVSNFPRNHLKIIVINKDFTVEEMSSALDRLEWTFKPDIIFSDYVGLMSPNERSGDGVWQETSVICEELKDFARDKKIPIVTMAQLKPQSAGKLEITFDDIAISKGGLTIHANVVFAILADEHLKVLGRAILQILKMRGKRPAKLKYDLFPDLDAIRIDQPSVSTGQPVQHMPTQTSGVILLRETGVPV